MNESGYNQSSKISLHTRTAGGIAILFLLFLAFLAIRDQAVPPDVVSASAPETEFSAERARNYLREITREVHPVGSSAHQRVREYLLDELENMGLEPEVQSTTGFNDFYGYRMSDVHNILVKIPGTSATGGIGLISHYDSVPNSYGASDAGNGVAAILETARAVLAGEPLQNDLYLLIMDSEETGLIGSQAFIDEHPWFEELNLVMNFEGRGDSGPAFMFRTVGGENGELIKKLAKQVPDAIASSYSNEILRIIPNDTDLSNFDDAGIPGMDIANIAGVLHYHTSEDSFTNADPRTLQHHGNYMLSLTKAFGNRDLSTLESSNRIYFNLLFIGLVHYPEYLAVPLAIFAFLFVTGVIAAGFKKNKLTWKGITAGFLTYPLLVVLLSIAAHFLWAFLSESIENISWFQFFGPHNSSWFITGIFSLVVAGFLAVHLILKRWFSASDLACGPLILWLTAGIALSFFLPGIAYLFIWPAIFTGAALLFCIFEKPDNYRAKLTALLLTGGTVLLLLAPLVWHLKVTLTIMATGPLTGLFLMTLGFLVLQLDISAEPFRWKLPLAFLAAALIFITGGISTSGLSSEHKKPNGVNYFANLDEDKALWYSPGPAPDDWTSFFLGDEPSEKKFSEFEYDEIGTLLFGAPENLTLIYNEAPVQDVGMASLEVLSDSLTENGRKFHILITPEAETYYTELLLPGENPVENIYINGNRINSQDENFSGERLIYFGSPETGFEMEFTYSDPVEYRLTLISAIPGLPNIPELDIPDRDETMMKFFLLDFTQLMKTFELNRSD
ncbi:MAG: M28 family peptidase [Balneolaceae bacterium]|nr:M28 family peptidase [Balneolaceae bacterium]